MSIRGFLFVWLLLVASNYIYAAIFKETDLSDAGERTFFQLLAVLACWLWQSGGGWWVP